MGITGISLWDEAAQLERNRTACDGGMDGFCQRGCCQIRPMLWAQVKQDSPPPPPLLWLSFVEDLITVSRLGWYGAPEPPKHMNPPVAVQPGNYRHVLQHPRP